ncbi:ABC transporter permease [Georgenia sp. MJ170]|uniref:ABC transporter permease n=1 Tax=Georgenia sunbinii TaxID=3117728 RepID=UPI002F26C9F6
MLRLTLSQMRHSTGRLLAAGLAIVVGTAFIAATLVGSSMIRDTTYAAMTAELGDADVVAENHSVTPLSAAKLAEVRALPGVRVADGQLTSYGTVTTGGRQDWAQVDAVPAAGLTAPVLVDGELPRALGEVALSDSMAERLDAGVGDTVTLETELWLPAADGTGTDSTEDGDQVAEQVTAELTVVGITEAPLAITSYGSTAMVSAAQRDAWVDEAGLVLGYSRLLVGADDGVSPDALAADVAALLPGDSVLTGQQLAEQRTAELTGQNAIFTTLILAFGAIAMFVAAIVITNTFQVIVAQRTHTLALLRAVGATKAQVRRSVLIEALLLGTLAGVAGLLAGLGLAQLAVWILGSQDVGVPLPDSLSISPAVILVPVLTGAVVTYLAALAPARAATAVSPLAALRPPQPPDPRGASRLRLVVSVLLIVVGGAMLAGGPALAGSTAIPEDSAVYLGLALSIGGGVVSFAGVMLGVVFIAPALVRLMGAVVGRLGGGSTVRLATANATRNPRRTAATATALVIGVTLVTLMSTGAVSARASLDALLRAEYPVDMTVTSTEWEDDRPTALTAEQVAAITGTAGVERTADVEEGLASIIAGPAAATEYGQVPILGLDAGAVRDVALDPTMVADLSGTTVVVPAVVARDLDLTTGDQLTLGLGDDPDVPATGGVELTVAVTEGFTQWRLIVTPEVLAEIDPAATMASLWVRLDESVDAAQTITTAQDRLTEAAAQPGAADEFVSPPSVAGPAAERAMFEQVINTLLAIVVGLLGVAVVIALIGVANTLSLSVLERRRESAVLRAIGLTRRQLRGMLAVEGVFLAAVGVVIGTVLGLLYGWAGAAVILIGTGSLSLAVPWAHLGIIVVVAVLAGLAASVLPARSAARTPPVAALAAE